MLRMLRQFGEATRRASVGAMETYAELIERLGPESLRAFRRGPSFTIGTSAGPASRGACRMAEWLTSKHLTRRSTPTASRRPRRCLRIRFRPGGGPEATRRWRLRRSHRLLHRARPGARRRDGRGGRAEAGRASRYHTAVRHDGRVVKLLGDGVLIRFGGPRLPLDGSLDLLERLEETDLPLGHVGVAEGPIVARDGDVRPDRSTRLADLRRHAERRALRPAPRPARRWSIDTECEAVGHPRCRVHRSSRARQPPPNLTARHVAGPIMRR